MLHNSMTAQCVSPVKKNSFLESSMQELEAAFDTNENLLRELKDTLNPVLDPRESPNGACPPDKAVREAVTIMETNLQTIMHLIASSNAFLRELISRVRM